MKVSANLRSLFTALAITLLATQAIFSQTGIVDTGYPRLRQFADVNADGLLDYCRFVGNAPNVFLSCQLRISRTYSSNTGYSDEPYGFNSIKGIDQGYPNLPRKLIDINGDKRADFCRYVGDAPNVRLSCDLAGKSGFEPTAQDSDPIADTGFVLRQLADVNGDGVLDYCRFVGTPMGVLTTSISARAVRAATVGDPAATTASLTSTRVKQATEATVGDPAATTASLTSTRVKQATEATVNDPATATASVTSTTISRVKQATEATVNDPATATATGTATINSGPFLSCQLGNPRGGYSKEPYGFNSMKGIDQGNPSMARALIDINGDKRADFCRYVGEGADARLSCDLAGDTGFEAVQYTDPSNYLAAGDKRDLVMPSGSDLLTLQNGTPISYITNSSTGKWYANGTDGSGTPLRLRGMNYTSSGVGGRVVASSFTDLYAYERYEVKDRILTVQIIWNAEGGLHFVINGTNASRGTKGLEYTQSAVSDSNTGYGFAHLHQWDCKEGELLSRTTICDSYFGGKHYSIADKPQWDGKIPQPLTQYLPEELNKMAYFQPLMEMKTAEMDALIKTGISWFDAKHWYEHTSDDWGIIQSALTQDAQDRISRVRLLADLGKITGAVIGASLGGVPGAFIGSTIGNIVFGRLQRDIIDATVARDREWCTSVNNNWPGCGEREILTQ